MIERIISIIALVGVVGILIILGLGRIRAAENEATAARAKTEQLQEKLDSYKSLKDDVIFLAQEVIRLRILVASLGGDPTGESSSPPTTVIGSGEDSPDTKPEQDNKDGKGDKDSQDDPPPSEGPPQEECNLPPEVCALLG